MHKIKRQLSHVRLLDHLFLTLPLDLTVCGGSCSAFHLRVVCILCDKRIQACLYCRLYLYSLLRKTMEVCTELCSGLCMVDNQCDIYPLNTIQILLTVSQSLLHTPKSSFISAKCSSFRIMNRVELTL